MATTFEVKYYQSTPDGIEKNMYEKVITEQIKARYMELQDGMVVFYDNGSGKIMKAVYSNFISAKEV